MSRIALLIPAILLALAALSCGRGPQPLERFQTRDGRIVVDFWHAVTGNHARSINEMADAFNASQDQFLVRAVYQGHYGALQQKLIASLYAGQPPAMSMVYESWANHFLAFGNLQPVEHFLREDREWAEANIPDIFEPLIANNSYPLRYDDYYGWVLDPDAEPVLATLPFNKSLYMLFINDTLMRELGFEHEPRTWDELRAMADAMTVRVGNTTQRFGFGTRRTMESITPFIFAAGINYIDAYGNFTMDTPQAEAAIRFLADLVLGDSSSGYVEPGFLTSSFGSGRLGMYVGSTAAFPFNDNAVGTRFIWRAVPVPPMDEDTEAKVLSQGTNIGIFKQGFNGMGALPMEVQQGAWEFLKFLMTPENAAKWAMDTGYIPVRRAAVETPEMQAFLANDPNFARAVELIPQLAHEPRPIWWNDIRDLLAREVEAVLIERKTPEEMLRSVQVRATAIRDAGAGI